MTAARRHCHCGTPLARDNTGTACAACQRTAHRGRAPEVPHEFWDTEVMVDALASGHLGRVIRAYRSHPFHGDQPLSQTVVADWLHVSQTSLSRIERGQCRLTVDDINAFARSLGVPGRYAGRPSATREKTWTPSAVGAFLARALGP
jgi:hypothetical protein